MSHVLVHCVHKCVRVQSVKSQKISSLLLHSLHTHNIYWITVQHIVHIDEHLSRHQKWKMSDLDRWLEISRDCKYLPENDLKQLCDLVCDLLLEESNIQPVSTPVTVCGDIHGQVRCTWNSSHTVHTVALWHRIHRHKWEQKIKKRKIQIGQRKKGRKKSQLAIARSKFRKC